MAKSVGQSEVETTASETHLRIEDLRKTFGGGDIVAVDRFNLSIEADEFIVFLGPSGCGKTTTLRCIAGLEQPDSGHIYIDGKEVTDARPKDRNLAFVFQSIALFPHMTVRRNIRFGLDINSNLSSEEKHQRVEETAEMLGINEFLDRKPSALSGGQQQRVAIGRAIVIDPEAFLMDEPFSALDANLRDQMQTEIQRIHNEIDKSMVFVTHDQDEAMTLGDRIVIMDEGQIKQIGSPYDIYNEPESLFVATFIGSPSTNVFDGVLEDDGERLAVSTDMFFLELTADQSQSIKSHAGDQVNLGVRPGWLSLSHDDGLFEAEIQVIEPQGDQDVVHLTSDGNELRSLTDQGKFTEVGDQIAVSIDPRKAWLFDDTGDRVL